MKRASERIEAQFLLQLQNIEVVQPSAITYIKIESLNSNVYWFTGFFYMLKLLNNISIYLKYTDKWLYV